MAYVEVSATKFKITTSGLKPLTKHKFYLLDKDVSADCKPLQISGSTSFELGSDLISDSNGKLEFEYYFEPENTPYETRTSTEYVQIYAFYSEQKTKIYAKVPVGDQKVSVKSDDGTSYAISKITVKNSTGASTQDSWIPANKHQYDIWQSELSAEMAKSMPGYDPLSGLRP